MGKDYNIVEGAPLVTTISLHEWMTMKSENDALRQAVALFARTLSSGQGWTEECEQTYRAVIHVAPK